MRKLYIGLSSFIGFVLLAIFYESYIITYMDDCLIDLIQQLESDKLTVLMKFFSFIGSIPFYTIVVIAVIPVLFLLKHRFQIMVLIVAMSGSFLFNPLLKSLFDRSRPSAHPLAVVTGYSFPSGHSMNAIVFYSIITFILCRYIPNRRGRFILIGCCSLMILIIGFSRVYLGVHYPSDVIGAYLIGFTWLIILYSALRKFDKTIWD